MGMKQIYNIMVGMALMLGATSCEEEILDNGQAAGIALADGQFIIDYSGEVTTRAIKDNAAKGERINSLTYLLYKKQENDYVLEKRREIPGLDGNTESWPLTRDNMTWEQREALKDTLLVGSNYRAVFVANADASLWNGTSPLKEADFPTGGSAAPSYSSAYLQLPEDLAFNDGNMFYLAEAEINGAGKDRETPYNCSITLKRVVTRTDWWFERLPEYDETNTEVDWKQTEEVKAYSDRLMYLVVEDCWTYISQSIESETTKFLDALIAYFTEQGKNTEPDATTLEEPYQTYVTQLTAKKTLPDDYVNVQLSNNMEVFYNTLRSSLLDNNALLTAWQRSWRDGLYARLVYSENSYANRIYLNRDVTHEDATINTSPVMLIDSNKEDGEYKYEGFHFVGLANPNLNSIAKVEFLETADADNSSQILDVPVDVQSTGQGINEHYGMLYRPIAELDLLEVTETLPQQITCNLKTELSLEEATPPVSPEGSLSLVDAIQQALSMDEELKEYGTSLEAITLEVQLPNLSSEAVLTTTDSWEIREE